MAFSYVAGTDPADVFGLVSWTDLRLGPDGTFRPLILPPLLESAPRRVSTAPAPRGGGSMSSPLLDVWEFDIAGWFLVDTADDVQGAVDYLMEKAHPDLGVQTVTFDAPGWADPQTMSLQVTKVAVDPREKGEGIAPEREFVISVLAADPRRYGAAVAFTVTTGGVSVTNAGTTPSPFVARFNGPLPDPVTINGPGTGNLLGITGGLSSGEWVEVTTVDPSTGSLTAVDDTGANAFARVSGDGSVAFIRPGAGTWTKSGGTGTVTLTVSPAYA